MTGATVGGVAVKAAHNVLDLYDEETCSDPGGGLCVTVPAE